MCLQLWSFQKETCVAFVENAHPTFVAKRIAHIFITQLLCERCASFFFIYILRKMTSRIRMAHVLRKENVSSILGPLSPVDPVSGR